LSVLRRVRRTRGGKAKKKDEELRQEGMRRKKKKLLAATEKKELGVTGKLRTRISEKISRRSKKKRAIKGGASKRKVCNKTIQ